VSFDVAGGAESGVDDFLVVGRGRKGRVVYCRYIERMVFMRAFEGMRVDGLDRYRK
jgi:hypothetical protein